MGKITNRYWVVEGTHKDPNDQDTIDHRTETEHGPFEDETRILTTRLSHAARLAPWLTYGRSHPAQTFSSLFSVFAFVRVSFRFRCCPGRSLKLFSLHNAFCCVRRCGAQSPRALPSSPGNETGCARFSQPLCTPLAVSASEQPLACCLMHRAPAAGGTDQHGQDVTKACVRACKDAISWNSIPSLERLVPGGNDNVKLRLQLAVPYGDGDAPPALDMDKIRACFAYGTLQEPVELMPGGARFSSMCSVPSLCDDSRDASWVVAIACVTVGY